MCVPNIFGSYPHAKSGAQIFDILDEEHAAACRLRPPSYVRGGPPFTTG
jgi:hypothetical protein